MHQANNTNAHNNTNDDGAVGHTGEVAMEVEVEEQEQEQVQGAADVAKLAAHSLSRGSTEHEWGATALSTAKRQAELLPLLSQETLPKRHASVFPDWAAACRAVSEYVRLSI